MRLASPRRVDARAGRLDACAHLRPRFVVPERGEQMHFAARSSEELDFTQTPVDI